MNFDLSTRFKTNSSTEEILKFLEESFRKSAETVVKNGETLTVESVNATFGSINRDDKTIVVVKSKCEETLIVASVEYKPSIWFWIFFVCSLFTTIFWLVPIAFYFYQKKTVINGIEEILNRVENEFRGSNLNPATVKSIFSEDACAQLEKLASLKEKGILSDEEFAARKAKILSMM